MELTLQTQYDHQGGQFFGQIAGITLQRQRDRQPDNAIF
jgi:hypothetical protein